MRKIMILLGSCLLIAACTKEVPVTRPHDFTAEIASEPGYENVGVTIDTLGGVQFSKEGSDTSEVCGCTVYTYSYLNIVSGSPDDMEMLLEETFWGDTSASWIYAVTLPGTGSQLESLGFANVLRWAYGEDLQYGFFLYAGTNVFDRMNTLSRDDKSIKFNVRLKNE